MEYTIYADESDDKGPYYSDFYGGVLVRSIHLDGVKQTLAKVKAENNLHGEVKWQKVTDTYLSKYVHLMDAFFDLVAADLLKIRVMFRQTADVAVGLQKRHVDEKYHILYYQFLKHAFGLRYSDDGGARVRIYLDTMPCTALQAQRFVKYLTRLNRWNGFRDAGVMFDPNQIAQVRSHEHDIMQCLDVVLGSMQFRLNDKHKLKAPGSRRRGKRTVAKEALYRFIGGRIRAIYPGFNIGITTGLHGDRSSIWRQPYRHWKFVPKDRKVDRSRFKP